MAEERLASVQGYSAGIPWAMHLRAYDAYCKLYGKQQALIEGHCRGGFGVNELDMFIPGWREELSELHRLRADRDEWQRRAAEAEKSVHDMNQHVVLAERKAAAGWAAAVAAAKAKVESLGGWELSYGSMDAEPDGRYLERQDVLAVLATVAPPWADQPAGPG